MVDGPLGRVGPILAHLHFPGHDLDSDAADAGRRSGEVLVDEVLVEAEGFEDLGAVVALDGADAHLADDLDDAFGDCLAVLLLGQLRGAGDHAQADLVVDRFEGKIRIDGAGAVAEEQGEVLDFARLAGLEDEPDSRAGARSDEVVVDGRHREKSGNGRVVGVVAAVRQDDDVVPFGDRLGTSIAQLFDGLAHPGPAVRDVEERRQRDRLEAVKVSVS